MKAILSIQTGLREEAPRKFDVTILGYAWGKHTDALGYGRSGECMLAIVQRGSGLMSVPITWLTISTPQISG